MKNCKSWFSMLKNEGERKAVISIYDEIGGWGVTANMFRDALKSLGEIGDIELRINSPGGSVIDGFAIFNMLREHPARVVAKIDGWAASMASIIAMAADEIHMPSNTWMMIHNPWTGTMGDKEELRKMADILEKMEGHAVQAYQLHSKLSDKEIADLMNAETWMDGKEAVEKGFAEVLLDELEIAASVNNSKMLKAPQAAMAWVTEKVKAEETETPPPPAEEPAKVEEGTTDGTTATESADSQKDPEKPAEDKPADAGAPAGSVLGTVPEAGSITEPAKAAEQPDLLKKCDEAYDAGESAGFERGKKETEGQLKSEMVQLKADLQAKREENSTLAVSVKGLQDQVNELKGRLSKLGGGFGASNMDFSTAPARFEDALKTMEWDKARKQFPELYAQYRAFQKSQRK